MKQQYINRIMELAKNLTDSDRKAAEKALQLSEYTITKYLSGDIVKFDIADRLIAFLESRVTEAQQS